ncbi:hypothetical protein F5880DRAFT_1511667 [Lentinula raphanica]|nr:hypothetical protein F5880DRAFT_1511667 [Lentinula raphanica]
MGLIRNESEWQITLNPFRASVLRSFAIAGIICQTSPCGNKFLVANDSGAAYELHSFSSRRPPQLFVPRQHKEAQPITSANFLSNGIVVGGSIGQIVIWDGEARRLQNIDFLDHQNSPIRLFQCVYRPQIDVAWIASVVDGRRVILWEWNGDGAVHNEFSNTWHTQRGIAWTSEWLKSGMLLMLGAIAIAVIARTYDSHIWKLYAHIAFTKQWLHGHLLNATLYW